MAERTAVIGYGPVGRDLTALLSARGEEVRIVQRRTPTRLPARCSFLSADAEDEAAMRRACGDVRTVACCVGFPYDSRIWGRAWPKAMSHLLAGCAASGARFVFADNLYMYGPQTAPLVETMPLTIFGRKPRIRAEITRQWQEAHHAGRVRAVAVRASDFYGPDVATSVVSELGVRRLVAGKAALVPYSADQPHDFTYVPDFARALLALIDAPDEDYGQAWHVPNAPTRSLREILELAAARIGVPAKLDVIPRPLALLLGVFNRPLAEVDEMSFQRDRPYLVDASKFTARFGMAPTSFEEGLDATISFYRSEK
jgi:nucleoside-diphosphate-sugar epimerase